MGEHISKETIAEAALRLFARKGFESVGVNEIAEQAGLAKPSLYHHFGSKDGLLTFIVEREGRKLLEPACEAMVYRRNLVMNLRALLDCCVDFAYMNEAFFRLMLRLFASAPETPGFDAGAALRAGLISRYETLFRQASEDHGNMRGRERLYAETFWGLCQTCAICAANKILVLDTAERFRIVHQFMHGIFS